MGVYAQNKCTYPKEGKIRVGNGEKLIFSTTILPHCQIVSSGVHKNLI